MQIQKTEFLKRAIEIANHNFTEKSGGPFGAVIVRDGKIIAEAINTVVRDNDPTAHAEVNAIREACRKLDSFQISGCEIYCSCEPCPMCLGAIYWARPNAIYFAASREDAEIAGFDDSYIYKEMFLEIPERNIKTEQMLREEAVKLFRSWKDQEIKIVY
ncbi:MAG: nucleoside deaminase [Bacteroidales bacterium]|nr:nucleoside deaminase [Bacteroidales bacterium]